MLERVQKVENEFLEIQGKLSDPAVISDMKKYTDLSRRYKELQKIVDLGNLYKAALKSLEDAKDILKSEDDKDMRLLAEEQKATAEKDIADLDQKIEFELLPKDPNDFKNVIIEIRAGAGGDEAGIFAGDLMRMYMKYAEKKGFRPELIDKSEGTPGCYKEVVFRIAGDGAYSIFKFESGVHRVQRVPVTESQGRIHTSTATVAVLPEAEEVDVQIRTEDLRIDVYRASGAGGQHVNKTESAVRITHIPTGVVVACQDERSQLKNKEKAMGVLRAKIYAAEEERLAKEMGKERASQIGTADRSEKIRTYNYPQDRVTEHRIHKNYSNIPAIMEGEIEDIVMDLREANKAELLAKAVG